MVMSPALRSQTLLYGACSVISNLVLQLWTLVYRTCSTVIDPSLQDLLYGGYNGLSYVETIFPKLLCWSYSVRVARLDYSAELLR